MFYSRINFFALLVLATIVVLAEDVRAPPPHHHPPPPSNQQEEYGSQQQQQFPTGDIRNCPTSQSYDDSIPLNRMDVLPGLGFDNLRNVDMGQVYQYNYSTCRCTNDGKFLIPDDTFVVPMQQTQIRLFADYFDHWDNFTSLTAGSINTGIDTEILGLETLNGKYSKEYQDVKYHQVKEKTKTARVYMRHIVYEVKLNPDAQLSQAFMSRIYQIASSLHNNNTDLAEHHAELLIRDYGTHFVTSIDGGAIFAKVDHIDEDFANSIDKTRLSNAATMNFPLFKLFNQSMNLGFSGSRNSDANDYDGNRKATTIFTIGGPPITPDLNLTAWQFGVVDKIAAIDRRGDPLYYAITPSAFPLLNDSTLMNIVDLVRNAFRNYYEYNERQGCMDTRSRNFDYQANVDGKNCNVTASSTGLSFGGVYQMCSGKFSSRCSINPRTGWYSCPSGYTTVNLANGTAGPKGVYSSNYKGYWCAAHDVANTNKGYLFGGFYSPTSNNPLTGSQSCPPYYSGLAFLKEVTICLSNNYEQAKAQAVPFAGFYSCNVGNPLAAPAVAIQTENDWPQTCPVGYVHHPLAIEHGCEINICLLSDAFKSNTLHPPKRPPFGKQVTSNEVPLVVGARRRVIIRDDDGHWSAVKVDSAEAKDFFRSFDVDLYNAMKDSVSGASYIAIASLIVSIILTVVITTLIVLGIVQLVRQHLRKKRKGKYKEMK